MLVKTFQATDMPEALRMVKAEFGTNAMIISSKKERKKGFMGFRSTPVIEVTAALEVPRHELPEPRPARVETRVEARAEEQSNTVDEFKKSMLAPLARELKELRDRVETLTAREAEEARYAPPVEKPHDFRTSASTREPAADAFARSDQDSAGGIMFSALWDKAVTVSDDFEASPSPALLNGRQDALDQLESRLQAHGVGEDETAAIMGYLSTSSGNVRSQDQMRELFREAVSAHVRCSGPLKIRKNTQSIMALVGPTGVGKTTTIAKLAAIACKHGARVALITIDTFRIGAVDQLKTYSSIMNIPLTVATTPKELTAAIDGYGDRNLILIDTAGRSPRDKAKLLEMKEFLEVNPAIETHLCLSATTRDKELHQTVGRYGVLPVSRMLFTKLDESESFGCLVNTHMREKLPLSYFTTGQRVPEDIEIASSNRVADLVAREMNS